MMADNITIKRIVDFIGKIDEERKEAILRIICEEMSQQQRITLASVFLSFVPIPAEIRALLYPLLVVQTSILPPFFGRLLQAVPFDFFKNPYGLGDCFVMSNNIKDTVLSKNKSTPKDPKGPNAAEKAETVPTASQHNYFVWKKFDGPLYEFYFPNDEGNYFKVAFKTPFTIVNLNIWAQPLSSDKIEMFKKLKTIEAPCNKIWNLILEQDVYKNFLKPGDLEMPFHVFATMKARFDDGNEKWYMFDKGHKGINFRDIDEDVATNFSEEKTDTFLIKSLCGLQLDKDEILEVAYTHSKSTHVQYYIDQIREENANLAQLFNEYFFSSCWNPIQDIAIKASFSLDEEPILLEDYFNHETGEIVSFERKIPCRGSTK
eukprot:TRINITY_DN579_c0_g2_i1.p1 TRINITY_DN579_c0_g2~~TRINITY_DN579_c0_g2_i1.p1  ORF type:complete len:375 (+),score=79.67 TRINITY_DN579_c0_g2_i1:1061-2185(+)